MSSSYYTPTGNPISQSRGTSPLIRAEFALIDAAFQKLPSPAALAAGTGNYYVDVGTANAMAFTPSSSITALSDGMTFLIKAAASNTGSTTLTVTGIASNVAVVRPDGTALQAADITAGQMIQCTYSASAGNFQLLRGQTVSGSAGVTQAQVQNATLTLLTGIAGTNTITGSLSGLTGYSVGQLFEFVPANANTGATTININGLGAKNILRSGGLALTAGDLSASYGAVILYDGTQFVLLNPANQTATDLQKYVTTAGTSTAFTATPGQAWTAYTAGLSLTLNFNQACGDNPTLQVSGLASPPNLVKGMPDGSYRNIKANEIPSGWKSRVTVVASNQILVEDLPVPVGASMFKQATFSANYTVAESDRGSVLTHPTADNNARSFTINSGLPAGFTVTVANQINVVTLTPGASVTFILVGSGATGSRSLAANGIATLTSIVADTYYVTGGGIT